MKVNPSRQLTPQNHQQYINNQKNQDIKTSVQSAIAQINGQVKTIKYQYDNQKIQKAVITVVVSQEEAEKIKQFSDDVDIRIIIDESLSKSEDFEKKNATEKNQTHLNEKTVNNPEHLNNEDDSSPKDPYNLPAFSMTKGPNHRIYSVIQTNDDERVATEEAIYPINKESFVNLPTTLAKKNIKAYTRYNFKGIKTKDTDNFSLKI